MKKFISYIAVFLLCLFTASAYNVTLSPDSWSVPKAQRGEIVQSQFSLLNTGNETATFTITLTGAISSWGFISPTMAQLNANQSTNINVAFIIPASVSYTTYTGKLKVAIDNFTKENDISITVDKYTYLQNKTFSTTQELQLKSSGYSLRLKSVSSTVYAEVYLNGVYVTQLSFDINSEQQISDDIKVKMIDRYSNYATFTIYSVNQITTQLNDITTTNTSTCELEAWTPTYYKPMVVGSTKNDVVQFSNTCDSEIKIRKAWFLNTITIPDVGERPIYFDSNPPYKVEPGDVIDIPFKIDTTEISAGSYAPTLQIDYEVNGQKMKAQTYFNIYVSRKVATTVNQEQNTTTSQQGFSYPKDPILINEKFIITYSGIKATQQVYMAEPVPIEGVSGNAYFDADSWVWEGYVDREGSYNFQFILRENGGFVEKKNCTIKIVKEFQQTNPAFTLPNLTIDYILPANHPEKKLEFMVKLPNGMIAANAQFTIDERNIDGSLVRTFSNNVVFPLYDKQYCAFAYVSGYQTAKTCISMALKKMVVIVEPSSINIGDTVKVTLKDANEELIEGVKFTTGTNSFTGNPYEFIAAQAIKYSLEATAPTYEKWSFEFTPKVPITENNPLSLQFITPNASLNNMVNFTFSAETPFIVKDDTGFILTSGLGITGAFLPPKIGNYSIYANGSLLYTMPVLETKKSIKFSLTGIIIIVVLCVVIAFVIHSRGKKHIPVGLAQNDGPMRPMGWK